jgi:hypothetical protein
MSQPLSVTASTVADVLSPGVEKAGACIRKRIDSCEHRSLDLESPRAACGRSRLLVWKKFLGDPYLLEWINRFKPDLVLSGHVHNAPFYPEGSWIDRIGDTWVFNPGREPGPIPTHLNLDLDAMSAEWIAVEGESIRQLGLSDR